MKTNHTILDAHALRPDDEVLANIARGRDLTKDPPGLDMHAIVTRSMEAYWAAYDERVVEPGFNPALNWLAVQRLSTWRGFLHDLGAGPAIAAIAVVVVVASYGFATTWSAASLLVRDSRFVPGVVAVLASVAAAAWMYQNDKGKEYIGAFAACVFAALFIGGLSRSVSIIQTMKDLAKTQLEQFAVNQMATHQDTGQFGELFLASTKFRLSTGSTSSTGATYFLTAPGVPGHLEADVKPSSGTVKWTGPGFDYVANLFTGHVVKLEGDVIQIRDSSGLTIDLKQRTSAPLPGLHEGSFVLGAYDTKTKETSVLLTRQEK